MTKRPPRPGNRSMRSIAIIVAVLSSWPGVALAGQAPPATSDVAPATVVKVPSASLGGEQVATT